MTDVKKYIMAYVSLIFLLALSAFIRFGMIGGLTIGTLKAAIIICIFMHAKNLKGSGTIILGLIFFLIALVSLLTLDFFTRT